MDKLLNNVPPQIEENIKDIIDEVQKIVETAHDLTEGKTFRVSFTFEHKAFGDILTDEERFQQVCFITRHQCLPDLNGIEIEEKNNKYYISNLGYIRHILNEYRLILFNQSDSIYYRNLHNFCYRKLSNTDSTKGLTITVSDVNDCNLNEEFIEFLNANTKAIDYIIKNSDLDYLYNGILQHSDSRFTKKYWDDYYSGQLNYILLKNAILASSTKYFMNVYYTIMNCLTFPELGSL